jgi:hypothetical protein
MASSRANFTFCTIMPGHSTRCRDSLRAGLPHDRTPLKRSFPSTTGDHDAHPAPCQTETTAFLGVKRQGCDNRSSQRVAILPPLTLYACIIMSLGDTHTLYRSVFSTDFSSSSCCKVASGFFLTASHTWIKSNKFNILNVVIEFTFESRHKYKISHKNCVSFT